MMNKELREEMIAELTKNFLKEIENETDYRYSREEVIEWVSNMTATLSESELEMTDEEFAATYKEWLHDSKSQELEKIEELNA